MSLLHKIFQHLFYFSRTKSMVKKAIDLTKAVDLQRENKSPLRTFTTRVHYCLIS